MLCPAPFIHRVVNPDGKFINYYYSVTKPLSEKITSHFE